MLMTLHKPIYDDVVRLLLNGNQTFFLLGDRGIGKRTLIRQLASTVQAKLVEYEKFQIDDARAMKSLCARVFEQSHMFLINGDKATPQALQAILKLLEEPPKRCAMFISAASVALTTITSRCNMLIFPRLTNQELLDVLAFKGMNQNTALSLVPFAAGSVDGAYEAYRRQEIHKQYLKYFVALQERDEKFVFENLRKITKEDIRQLLNVLNSLLMSRYGFGENNSNANPEFLSKIKASFLSGSIPSIGWLRSWFATM